MQLYFVGDLFLSVCKSLVGEDVSILRRSGVTLSSIVFKMFALLFYFIKVWNLETNLHLEFGSQLNWKCFKFRAKCTLWRTCCEPFAVRYLLSCRYIGVSDAM